MCSALFSRIAMLVLALGFLALTLGCGDGLVTSVSPDTTDLALPRSEGDRLAPVSSQPQPLGIADDDDDDADDEDDDCRGDEDDDGDDDEDDDGEDDEDDDGDDDEDCRQPPSNDPDGDGIEIGDNCPTVFNPGQDDTDRDGIGDACDLCPTDPNNGCTL